MDPLNEDFTEVECLRCTGTADQSNPIIALTCGHQIHLTCLNAYIFTRWSELVCPLPSCKKDIMYNCGHPVTRHAFASANTSKWRGLLGGKCRTCGRLADREFRKNFCSNRHNFYEMLRTACRAHMGIKELYPGIIHGIEVPPYQGRGENRLLNKTWRYVRSLAEGPFTDVPRFLLEWSLLPKSHFFRWEETPDPAMVASVASLQRLAEDLFKEFKEFKFATKSCQEKADYHSILNNDIILELFSRFCESLNRVVHKMGFNEPHNLFFYCERLQYLPVRDSWEEEEREKEQDERQEDEQEGEDNLIHPGYDTEMD